MSQYDTAGLWGQMQEYIPLHCAYQLLSPGGDFNTLLLPTKFLVALGLITGPPPLLPTLPTWMDLEDHASSNCHFRWLNEQLSGYTNLLTIPLLIAISILTNT